MAPVLVRSILVLCAVLVTSACCVVLDTVPCVANVVTELMQSDLHRIMWHLYLYLYLYLHCAVLVTSTSACCVVLDTVLCIAML